MDAKFWHDMWRSGVVGFHQPEINAFLKKHWASLALQGNEKVLVPLCGKTQDMLWLAEQGHSVLGVELSHTALEQFVAENNLTAQPINTACYKGYQLNNMTLLAGDFFDLQTHDCQAVTVVYDRAALVALPPAMRADYVAHLQKILPPATKLLVITMEYDSSQLTGPPFCVLEQEVRALYSGFAQIQILEEACFTRKGVGATEKVFLIEL